MNATVWTYLIYLAISVTLTVWVAKTLHKNGRIFLVDAFAGNEPLADSINHLLVVGFYLVNIGFVNLALKYGREARQPPGIAGSPEHQGGRCDAGARRDALLQPRGVFADAPPGPAAHRAAAHPGPGPDRGHPPPETKSA